MTARKKKPLAGASTPSGKKRATPLKASKKAKSIKSSRRSLISQQEPPTAHSENLEKDTSGTSSIPSAENTESEQTSPDHVVIFGESYPMGQLPDQLPPEFKDLTAAQALFVVYYAVTRNGTEAARMAGYEGNHVTLSAVAYENLRKPHIAAAYDSYMRPVFEKMGLTVRRSIEQLADVAYAPWGDFVIVKEKKGRIVSVRMALGPKVKALETLLKVQRVLGTSEEDVPKFVDNSQHLHFHKYKTPDEARQGLLDYLTKRSRK